MEVQDEQQLRKQAIKQLKRKREFRAHLGSYVIVNAALVVIWALSGQGYFWPGWVMAGWGIGVLFNAWGVYGKKDVITEDQVKREMERLKG